ncbi:hypothetical protein GCM10022379_15590 [Micromonospora maritima]
MARAVRREQFQTGEDGADLGHRGAPVTGSDRTHDDPLCTDVGGPGTPTDAYGAYRDPLPSGFVFAQVRKAGSPGTRVG